MSVQEDREHMGEPTPEEMELRRPPAGPAGVATDSPSAGSRRRWTG